MARHKESPDPAVCVRCHGMGRGCCVLGGHSPEKMIGLTGGEVAEIARASGQAPGDFTITDQITPRFQAEVDMLHPVLALIMPGRRRTRLKVDKQGACLFLGQAGCTLPRESRPLYCRLFPFWFTPDARLMLLFSDDCLAQREASSLGEVLAALDESEANLRTLFARLIRLAHQDD